MSHRAWHRVMPCDVRKLKSQKALYESKLHIQKAINKLLGKELAELKAKLSEDLNKSS